MKKLLIFILLGITQFGFSMQKDNPEKSDEPKKAKSDSPLRNLPLISHLFNETKRSPTSSATNSPNASPVRGRGFSIANPEVSPRKPSPLSGSPTRFQLSKSLGKRESKEMLAHLKNESDKIENNKANTPEQLKVRMDKVKTMPDKDAKKKELSLLLNAEDANWDLEISKENLSKEFFALNADEIVAALKNNIMFLLQKNVQEAANQVVLCKKLYLENFLLLQKLSGWHYGSMIIRGSNHWDVSEIMDPIFHELKRHYNPTVNFDNLNEIYAYQESIKPNQFIPIIPKSKS